MTNAVSRTTHDEGGPVAQPAVARATKNSCATQDGGFVTRGPVGLGLKNGVMNERRGPEERYRANISRLLAGSTTVAE